MLKNFAWYGGQRYGPIYSLKDSYVNFSYDCVI